MLWVLPVIAVLGYLVCLLTAHDRIDDRRAVAAARAEWKAGRGGPILPLVFRVRVR